MQEISIYIKNLYDNFQLHLESNKRILFSGAYGIGKTYFLKEFFGEKKENYNVFHLFPVNYQVSQNEDIFELIKVDILNHILDNGWLFDDNEKEKIGKCLALQAYTINKASSVFENLLKIFTLGKSKSVIEGVGQLEEIGDKFSQYYDDINSNASLSKVKEFMRQIEEKRGSIYEIDNITQLISELLYNHKNKKEVDETEDSNSEHFVKENILIIDDIDRIDPEHIFRILNVFSAHFDLNNEDDNKFGFDKIIFVCDINNIRNIFLSQYGLNTDFNGYINKFFSSRIYYFDNKNETKETIKKYINYSLSDKKAHDKYIRIKDDISQFLDFFINSGTINIRHLKNLERFDFSNTILNPNYDEFVSMLPYVELLKLLLCMFNNDKQKLLHAFSYLNLDSNSDIYLLQRKNRYLGNLVPLLDYQRLRIYDNDSNIKEIKDFIYRNKDLNISIKYSPKYINRMLYAEVNEVGFYNTETYKYNNPSSNVTEKEFTNDISIFVIFDLFATAIGEIDKNGFLK